MLSTTGRRRPQTPLTLKLKITRDQRVQLKYAFPAHALTPAEADGYIRAHLAHAGRTDTIFSDDAVRHEALSDRAEVEGLRRLAVAAAG